jgi:histidinol dehydrogenase
MKIHSYPKDRRAIEKAFLQVPQNDTAVETTVRRIVSDVRENGDEALIRLSARFDKVQLTARTLRVSPKTCEQAWKNLPAQLSDALQFAREGIEAFHRKQVRSGFVLKRGGAVLEQRIRPLNRIGAYVPGGAAAYPSTMLMNVIPAQVAGVREIIVATPPVRENAARFVPFAVAHMLGVSDSIYQVGGAQAVAALAYGTRTIPRVDKVVGPGNEYVATAKRLLYGTIDIDSVAGNSEVLIIADEKAPAAWLAADLLAQAEHTGGESVVLVGIGSRFDFAAVERELKKQLAGAPRREQAERSVKNGGLFIRVPDAESAVEVAEMKAPEHLEIIADDAESIADRINNVGAIFLGPYTPEPIGDYVAGPNHVLPTGGTARFFSPLGVDAFLKASNVLRYSRKAFEEALPHVVNLAESEGLHAHAEAMRVREKLK